MPTPHFTLRVRPEQLDRWRSHCENRDIDVSSQIRRFMDAWCDAEDIRKELEEVAN